MAFTYKANAGKNTVYKVDSDTGKKFRTVHNTENYTEIAAETTDSITVPAVKNITQTQYEAVAQDVKDCALQFAGGFPKKPDPTPVGT